MKVSRFFRTSSASVSLIMMISLFSSLAWAKPKANEQPIRAGLIRKVDEALAEVERLKLVAAVMACESEQRRFQVEVRGRVNACEARTIEFRTCIARVRDRQSGNTGKGALIGLGAAVLTGGASLLFTGAGAIIGHQASDEAPNECGSVPNCSSAVIIAATTRETGLRQVDCQSISAR